MFICDMNWNYLKLFLEKYIPGVYSCFLFLKTSCGNLVEQFHSAYL